jgi:hypothetical protein
MDLTNAKCIVHVLFYAARVRATTASRTICLQKMRSSGPVADGLALQIVVVFMVTSAPRSWPHYSMTTLQDVIVSLLGG